MRVSEAAAENMLNTKCKSLIATTLLAALASVSANSAEIDVWEQLLRPHHFPELVLHEGDGQLELNAPYRAEDAALTPISVRTTIAQTSTRYVEKLWIFVDNNPQSLAGLFHLTPAVGPFELATRIRIEQYTQVRAVVAFNTGEHFHVAKFVKAQGGCSAPLGSDLQAAKKTLGRIRFREFAHTGAATLGQLNIKHPNVTGLQLNQKTRLIAPAHYVENIILSLNDSPILEAQTGFSLSENPSIRFVFRPAEGDTLKVDVIDSKGMTFSREFQVGSSAP